MKILILICAFSLIAMISFAQSLYPVSTTNWNKIQKAGFFISQATEGSNNPIINNNWWWGINIPSGGNENNGTFHNAQIAIMSSYYPAQIYVRSTNVQGEGGWARIIHSKGNHAIDGKLTAKEIEIKVNTGADFVFLPEYKLKPLSAVEAFVKENQHLPDVPSEKEMIEKGVSVNEMQIKLLQKIEELTLYVIEQDKRITEQNKKITEQDEKIKHLSK